MRFFPFLKKSPAWVPAAALAGLLLAGSAQAAVLVKDATVTALLNDFWGSNLLVAQLSAPAAPTYPCGESGNDGGTDSVWRWDYDELSAADVRNADTIYTLLNMAWLTEMTVAVESDSSSEDCDDATYIILHNPAYP